MKIKNFREGLAKIEAENSQNQTATMCCSSPQPALGVSLEEKYYSCSMIERFSLNFYLRIDKGDKCLTLCCEGVAAGRPPGTAFQEAAQESMESFRQMRDDIIAESKKFNEPGASGGERKFTQGCAKCANYRLGEWRNDGLIHHVNLSMYPARCQGKCIYCGMHKGHFGVFKKADAAESYEKMFNAIDYARENGMIAMDAAWQVSSGEITIHPYRDRIFDLVKNQAATFFTNCFIYDKKIAQNLASNPRSAINLSIDSGTPQTWFKVKGVDNFDDITNNLVKYHAASARSGQITLKYIVLPGLNDTREDYLSVIELMKALSVKHLDLSRDTRIKYALGTKQRNDLIKSMAYLVAMLHKNKMTFSMGQFSLTDQEQINTLANDLLRKGSV
jgi:wyosine [tRNA(Phe)-imidazoG37] synthetase (radical SAM superfamily)